jgi:hypothetical protein
VKANSVGPNAEPEPKPEPEPKLGNLSAQTPCLLAIAIEDDNTAHTPPTSNVSILIDPQLLVHHADMVSTTAKSRVQALDAPTKATQLVATPTKSTQLMATPATLPSPNIGQPSLLELSPLSAASLHPLLADDHHVEEDQSGPQGVPDFTSTLAPESPTRRIIPAVRAPLGTLDTNRRRSGRKQKLGDGDLPSSGKWTIDAVNYLKDAFRDFPHSTQLIDEFVRFEKSLGYPNSKVRSLTLINCLNSCS